MPLVSKNCPHIGPQGDLSIVEYVINEKQNFDNCLDCDSGGPLWLCLYPECRYVGCSEKLSNHSTLHNITNPSHSTQMNLTSKRIWCYDCNGEVRMKGEVSIEDQPANLSPRRLSPSQIDFKIVHWTNDKCSGDDCNTEIKENAGEFRRPIDDPMDNYLLERNKLDKGDPVYDKSDDESSDMEESSYSCQPRGLVGLQNIGNTCYMNSALQALSNIPSLTNYFLDCENIIEYVITDNRKESKHPLSFSYLKLMKDMWSKDSRSYVVPHALLTGIRIVHPMFRGYHQHDTQEFLRCFMDQLHEELKEHTEDSHENHRLKQIGEHSSSDDEEEPEVDGTGSSQSDGEYETCDSGVSEQSSLSDEGERGMKQTFPKSAQQQSEKTIGVAKFVNRGLKKPAVEITSFPSQQNSPQKNRTKKQKHIKTKSIISDVFDGKLLSSVQCLTCDRISTRVETFQDLSLPIPRDHTDMSYQGSLTPQKASSCSDVYATSQSGWIAWFLNLTQYIRSWFWGPIVSLHNCLSAFFSADELKGDNMYSCEKCNKLRNGTKFSEVLELPEILCIHLKRFRHELMFSSKISNYVSFPLEGLDMRPFVHKDCVSKVTYYNLVSVICHHGTAGGGHYVCYALNPIINQWFEFDDQRVTRVSPETVKNCEAYVLFYGKYSSEMQQVREKTYELMELSSKNPWDLKFYISRQWVHRLNTFAEPGPIDNSDFLCPHGGINPLKDEYLAYFCMPVPQRVWEYLLEIFGGGPVCNHLYECSQCREALESLQQRRQYEAEMYQRIYQLSSSPDKPVALYALSMTWFRLWQNFIKGRENQPPGPIDNSSILVSKGGQNILKVSGSDYVTLSEEVWKFFESTYGGGPELMLPSSQRPMPVQQNAPVHSSPNLDLLLLLHQQRNSKANNIQLDSTIKPLNTNESPNANNDSQSSLKVVN